MRIMKLRLPHIILLPILLLASSTSWALDTSNWLPVDLGNSWTYRDSSNVISTETVAATNVLINGVNTVKLLESNGDYAYESHDSNGHRLHRMVFTEFVPQVSANLTTTINFQPGALMLPANATIGQTVRGSGQVTMTISGYGSYNLSYTIDSTVRAQETLFILGSNVSTYRTDYVISIFGTVQGQAITVSENLTAWFQPGIGGVKWTENFDGTITNGLLVSTNVSQPVILNPDLLAFQTIRPSDGLVGDNFQFNLKVRNLGADSATGVVMQGSWPGGMQFQSISANNASCSTTGTGYSCRWSTLTSGSEEGIQLNLNAPTAGTYNNALSVQSDQTDADNSNNSDQQTIYVNQASAHTGDISPANNPDGRVTIADALQALRYALRIDSLPGTAGFQLADVAPTVNGLPVPDGKLSLSDALTILRKALGLINY